VDRVAGRRVALAGASMSEKAGLVRARQIRKSAGRGRAVCDAARAQPGKSPCADLFARRAGTSQDTHFTKGKAAMSLRLSSCGLPLIAAALLGTNAAGQVKSDQGADPRKLNVDAPRVELAPAAAAKFSAPK